MTQLKYFAPDEEAETESSDQGPGSLLAELERRQDDVLAKLDELNSQVESVLRELGVKLDELDNVPAPSQEDSVDES